LVSLIAMGYLGCRSCGTTLSPHALYAIHSIEYQFYIVNSRKLIERMFSLLNTQSRIGTSWALPGKILLLARFATGNPGAGIIDLGLSTLEAMVYPKGTERRWTPNCLKFLVGSLLCGGVAAKL